MKSKACEQQQRIRWGIRILITVLLGISFQTLSASGRNLNTYFDLSKKNKSNIALSDDPEPYTFDLPTPPPSYPAGTTKFGQGSIDLGGGLQIYEALYFTKIWSIDDDGPNGVSFFEPTSLPPGYMVLGHFASPHAFPLFASVVTAKDDYPTTNDSTPLKMPTGYTLVWTSEGRYSFPKQGDGYIWLPKPPLGYKAVGHIVTTTRDPPALDRVRCVREDLTAHVEIETWIWGHKVESQPDFNLYVTRPVTRGLDTLSIYVGTFMALTGDQGPTLHCLRRSQFDLSAMPDLNQMETMIRAYAPWVYFHPNEDFYPSSVNWFFENGATLHNRSSNDSSQGNGMAIVDSGSNLPQNGSVDDFYIDLPSDGPRKDLVKRGHLPDAEAYIHIKPALAGTYTDIVIWMYYPFNGGGTLQIGPVVISLGRIGEHVSDWEHMTLRIDNFNGMLKRIYLSEHHRGRWLSAREFEYINSDSTRPIVYASYHGHALYAKQDHNLHTSSITVDDEINLNMEDMETLNIDYNEKFQFGLRNDTLKGAVAMDIAKSWRLMGMNHYGLSAAFPWLNFPGRWGPKFKFVYVNAINRITKGLPARVKKEARKILRKLPPELFGEEGPIGPIYKPSWAGDEDI